MHVLAVCPCSLLARAGTRPAIPRRGHGSGIGADLGRRQGRHEEFPAVGTPRRGHHSRHMVVDFDPQVRCRCRRALAGVEDPGAEESPFVRIIRQPRAVRRPGRGEARRPLGPQGDGFFCSDLGDVEPGPAEDGGQTRLERPDTSSRRFVGVTTAYATREPSGLTAAFSKSEKSLR